MTNGNGQYIASINAFRAGLSNGHVHNSESPYAELINNITSLRRGILDLVNDPRRNLEHDCGWPNSRSLTPEAYRDLYDSDAIANRIVNLMPKQCWQVFPEVYEKEKGSTETPFEKSWQKLNRDVSGSSWHGDDKCTAVLSILKRLDIVSGIGAFGVMLIGLDDGLRLDEPVAGVVDKVVGGIAFNKDNRLTDTWMTEDEEKRLLALNGQPIPDPINKQRSLRTPPPLNAEEQQVVNLWRSQRAVTAKAVATVIENQQRTRVANLIDTPDDGEDNPRSQKSMFGTLEQDGNPNPQSQQQWFGTQFGDPEKLADKPSGAKRSVTFLRVFDESSVQVTRWEASLLSPRFGQPVMYRITFNDPRDQSTGSSAMPSSTAFVHWSRVIHVADNKCVNESAGMPRLRPVINNVLDIRKVRGSGAEGYYQSCFPTLAFETHPQLGGDVDVDVAGLRGQIENLVNTLQRSVIGIGGAWKTLPPAVVDPKPHIEVGIEAICIQLSCPVRIFKGSERGELASGQDDSQWNDEVAGRQTAHCTPSILVASIDRFILMGVLEPPQKSLDDAAAEDEAQLTDPTNPDASTLDEEDPFAAEMRDSADPFAKPKPKPIGNKRWVYNAKTRRIEKRVVNAPPPFPIPKDEKQPIEDDSDAGLDADGPPTEDALPMESGEAEGQKLDAEGNVIETEAGYKIDWPDLDSLGDKDRAMIAAQLTSALAAYVQSGAADMMPLFEYLTIVWQMDDQEVQAIVTAMEKHQEEVQIEQEEQAAAMMDEHGMLPEAPEGFVDPEQRDMDHEVAMEQAKHGGGKPGGFGGPPGAGGKPGGGFPSKGPKKPKPGFPPVGNATTVDDITNAFCATGDGGGVDPTCGGEGDGTAQTDYKVDVKRNDDKFYHAKLGKGFSFEADNTKDGWAVYFRDKNDEESMTGKQGGSAVSVMRNVSKALDRFLEDKAPHKFDFSASNSEQSRVSLYSKASKFIAKQHGYDVKEGQYKGETRFYFTKLPAVANAQRLPFDVAYEDYLYWDDVTELVANAFCPTGDGGGQDNSCSPNGGTGGSSAAPSGSKADRIGKMVKREQSGKAPYIDLLITKLKQDKVVSEDTSPHLVFADLKRRSEGLEPMNTKVSGKQLADAMKALKEYGDLTPDELTELLPHMRYPQASSFKGSKDGGASGKELIEARRIPASVLDKLSKEPEAKAAPKPKAAKTPKAVPKLAGAKDVAKLTARLDKAKATVAKLKAELKTMQASAKGGGKKVATTAKAAAKEMVGKGADAKVQSIVDTIRKMEAGWLKDAKKGKSTPTGKQMEEQVLIAMGRASAHKVASGMGHKQRYGSASVARHNVATAVAERIHAFQRGKV